MTYARENFVVDAKGNRVGVFLPIKDYNKMLEELEELDDIKAYDKAVSRKQESKTISSPSLSSSLAIEEKSTISTLKVPITYPPATKADSASAGSRSCRPSPFLP